MDTEDHARVICAPSSALNSDELESLYTEAQDAQLSKANSTEPAVITAAPSLPTLSDEHEGTAHKMSFSSSPVLYPPSSSPPQLPKKRKLFQTLPSQPPKKKTRIIAGFIEEDEDEVHEAATQTETLPDTSIGAVQKSIPSDTPVQPIDGQAPAPTLLVRSSLLSRKFQGRAVELATSTGQKLKIPLRSKLGTTTYEELIAQRSVTDPNRAKKAYYGIEIHKLVDEAQVQRELHQAEVEIRKQKMEAVVQPVGDNTDAVEVTKHQMWTEKYRAKRFTELVGDERTHRSVLRWLKAWDDVVFPSTKRSKRQKIHEDEHDRQHRKVLLLTGPPGLGKTTLAHVCAKQAGYEALEINASDDRSREVVRGRIKDALGTETVRGVKEKGKERRAGRPVCVIVDEVDGAVAGSGASGDGGFVRALIDLIQLDERNSPGMTKNEQGRKKKGDNFRFLRPLILVCNDAYAPSLRPLRASSIAEIVHVRRPALDKVVLRMKTVFDMEKILCDNDAVRRLCETSWGMGTRKQNSLGGRGAGEGDLRSVLVQAEWLAHKFRSDEEGKRRLTRRWVETHLGNSQSSSGRKGLGRGGIREVIDRIFLEGAGLPNLPTQLSADDQRILSVSKSANIGVADLRKRTAITALREMVDMCGEHDRLMTDCFATYPHQIFQDDTRLSKPNDGYDWLHFHDCLSSRIFGGQEWELNPYLSTGACGFHHLFAGVDKGDKSWNDEKKDDDETETHPFSGLKADFVAYESEKQNRTMLTELQASFSASLLRLFSSVDAIATELIPNVNKIVAPDVKPVVVGGSGNTASVASVRKESEKVCVRQAVQVMSALGIRFEKVKFEAEAGGAQARAGFAYRMEPPLDTLTAFHLDKSAAVLPAPVRYAVRQVLDQELHKEKVLQNSLNRQARSSMLPNMDDNKENQPPGAKLKENKTATKLASVKRDFFGRVVNEDRPASAGDGTQKDTKSSKEVEEDRVWVSFHEGFSNAVRKPITLKELLESF